MFANSLHCFTKYLVRSTTLAQQVFKMRRANIYTTVWRLDDKPLMPVVDINMEDMMYEDIEKAIPFEYPEEDEDDKPYMTDNSGAPLAPIDIDPWIQPDEKQQGTVDVEMTEEEKKAIEYPPIPTTRTGVYEFKGIKVKLPQRMLRPETYRYRLEPEDQETLADDIRVCKF